MKLKYLNLKNSFKLIQINHVNKRTLFHKNKSWVFLIEYS